MNNNENFDDLFSGIDALLRGDKVEPPKVSEVPAPKSESPSLPVSDSEMDDMISTIIKTVRKIEELQGNKIELPWDKLVEPLLSRKNFSEHFNQIQDVLDLEMKFNPTMANFMLKQMSAENNERDKVRVGIALLTIRLKAAYSMKILPINIATDMFVELLKVVEENNMI